MPETASGLDSSIRRVLGVGTHASDESFDLGGVMAAWSSGGIPVDLVVLTAPSDPRSRSDLDEAADLLGIDRLWVLDQPGGGLAAVDQRRLAALILDRVAESSAEALFMADRPAARMGSDHAAAAQATITAGRETELPVLAWATPSRVARRVNAEYGTEVGGRTEYEIDYVLTADRSTQRAAMRQHRARSHEYDAAHRRLELTGDVDWVRWIVPPEQPSDAPGWV